MNLSYIKYFCDAVSEGSLVRAAELNFVTPGAISQAIKKLEEQWEVDLLVHKKRDFSPTAQGKLLAEEGRSLLDNYERVVEKVQGVDELSGEIHFGTQQSIASSLLPEMLKGFKKEYPNILPRFVLGNTTIIKNQMGRGQIEFAICLDNVDFSRQQTSLLHKGQFVVISKNGKERDEFLFTGDTPEVLQYKSSYKRKFKSEAKVAMNIKSWGVIKEMVLSSDYMGLVPDYLLKKNEEKLIVESLNIKSLDYRLLAVYPLNKQMSGRTRAFLEFCLKSFK